MKTPKEKGWEDEFDKMFVISSQKNRIWDFVENGNRTTHIKIKKYIHSLLQKTRREVIGEIGAKLLAEHSPQDILDAYFDVANELLEQYETTD